MSDLLFEVSNRPAGVEILHTGPEILPRNLKVVLMTLYFSSFITETLQFGVEPLSLGQSWSGVFI